ncbi:acyl-CoA dehydrogenase family protein [Aquabacter sp. CN5-332]|uniref:acyl-CoA dehydrogenase family protein n=1 Tax=Aquabacter sp. CN5-332 TaxID=3156608 RepID=UPI0032B51F86
MMSMTEPAISLLAAVCEIGPVLATRAHDIERERRIPIDVVERLKAIGVYRLFVPRSHGGLELDFPAGLEILREVAKIDGSLGWTTMIALAGALFTPLLPRQTYDDVYRNGPNVIVAGSVQPIGTAELRCGVWHVSGRWPLVSACQHADWLVGACVVTEGGSLVPGSTRSFALPASEWQIEDTWHSAGLKGTGSHHITIERVAVPEKNFFDSEKQTSCVPGPLYKTLKLFIPLLHAAVSLGIAEAAFDDIVAIAKGGRQQEKATAPMRESEMFRSELGRVDADLRAARAYFRDQVARQWRHALTVSLDDATLHVEGVQSAIWVTNRCVQIADMCFSLGGAAALYDSSPLQRRMRDLHAAAQHPTVQMRRYVEVGTRLLS